MKSRTMIGYSLLLILTVTSMLGCAQLRQLISSYDVKPEIRAIRPNVTGIDFQGVTLAFDVDLFNPYSVPLKSTSFDYALDVQGKQFLKSSMTTDVDLPAKDVGTVTLPVRLKYLDLQKAYSGLRNESEIPYELNGTMTVKPFGRAVRLPMKKSGTLPVLKMPEFSNVRIQPTDISTAEANFNIKTLVTNPNPFPISLDSLGYKLRMKNIGLADCNLSSYGTIEAGESKQIVLKSCLTGGIKSLGKLLDVAKANDIELIPSGEFSTPFGKTQLLSEQ